MDALFQLANAAAMIAWILLIVIPHKKITKMLVHSGFVILVFAAVYSMMIWSTFKLDMMGDFSSLAGVMKLFTSPVGVTVGWIHYLAFDLFVGLWITKEGLKTGMPRWMLIPSQVCTFMFGPMGLLIFYAFRLIHLKYLSPQLIQLD